jgi:tRNA nucleotidyltransferase (CCA-adding enzyme)
VEIITSHINADFDAFASMVAALKLYPKASLVFPGSQERMVRDFIEVFNPAPIKRIREVDLALITRLVIVDTKRPGRIGPLAGCLANAGLKVHIYDHHPAESGDITGETRRVEDVGATATMFAELIKEKHLPLSPIEATLLALGIYEETGSLLYPSTTERDLAAVGYLLKKGANLNIVSNYLKMDLNVGELDLLNELVNTSVDVIQKGIRIAVTMASRDS